MVSVPFWVVIPAAGCGSRMAADRPKQYLPVAGRCLIEHTLDCFLDHPCLLGLVVVLAAEDDYWQQLPCSLDTRVYRTQGGRERANSVLAGLDALCALGASADDWVLVHDAARPNLRLRELNLLLNRVALDPVGGLLALPARDTLKYADDGRSRKTLERRHIWQAQTPQMFRLALLGRALREALNQESETITDEASAVERMGLQPLLVEGRADNIKATTPEDLLWLDFCLRLREQDELYDDIPDCRLQP